MKALRKAILALTAIFVIGCGGAYFWSSFSAKVVLKDGTTIECPRGIALSMEEGGKTRCYKKTSTEDIDSTSIKEIVLQRKNNEAD